MGDLGREVLHLRARRHLPTPLRPPPTRRLLRRLALLAFGVAIALSLTLLPGGAQGPSLQVLTREGRRALSLATSGSQEMVLLDDLASAFQLAVRDDGGAITVGYKGRTIILTPDQTIASVAGRLISLPAPPVRLNGRWAVPLDFISRALAPIYDARLELRRASRLLLVGDVRVPRVAVAAESTAAGARVTVDVMPPANTAVTQQGQRLLVRIDADALDLTVAALQPSPFVQAIRSVDATSLAVDVGPRFGNYRSSTQPLDAGSRTVIEIVSTQTDAAPAPPPAAAPAADPLPRDLAIGQQPLLRTVAIDAGHGGTDIGARGAADTQEKDVTLAVARRVRAAIESRLGLRVVMTRDDDRDVPLQDRVAVANNNKADLFISLHANASFRPEVTGAAIYTAAFTAEELGREGLALERLPVFGGGQRDIEVVPWNLAQIRHRERSELFATMVSEALGSRVPLSTRPVERAPLRVLEPANMPAVLVETGYLTNADQEKALAGAELQATIAQAIVDAIVRFRDRLAGAEGTAP